MDRPTLGGLLYRTRQSGTQESTGSVQLLVLETVQGA